MLHLIRREFVVNVPLETAWQHLAQVEQWPSWAKHITSVELDPPGDLTRQSSGAFRLSNGIRSTFKMVELNPPKSWKWMGHLCGSPCITTISLSRWTIKRRD